MAFLVGGANSAADTGPYDIDNSLRFNDDDSAYLSITPGSAGNQKTWTWSCWVKRGNIGGTDTLLSVYDVSVGEILAYIDSSNQFSLYWNVVGVNSGSVTASNLLRDSSAYYHLLLVFDTTQGTASNRVKLYINGTLASLSASTYPNQNQDLLLNSTNETRIGYIAYDNHPYDGYLSEVNFIDGTAYDADDFGETDEDSGIWKPKKASVTYGTNGFFMEFKQSGTNQDSSGIGADTSGEDNHFAVTNLAATDQTTDTPTNNFCTLNPIDKIAGASIAFSEGNLKAAVDDNGNTRGNFFVNSGKWYWETLIVSGDSVSTVGIAEPGYYSGNLFDGSSTAKGYIYINDGNKRSPAGSAGAYGDSYADDDIIGVALNMDDGEVKFYKNNTVQNSGTAAFTSLSGDHGIYYQGYGGTATVILNTGHDSSFAGNKTAQNNADENGYGDFYYSPPSGFYALCTKNLAEFG